MGLRSVQPFRAKLILPEPSLERADHWAVDALKALPTGIFYSLEGLLGRAGLAVLADICKGLSLPVI
jgi:hypothetical protein